MASTRAHTFLTMSAREFCLPDAKCQGIFLADDQCQGIYLLDTEWQGTHQEKKSASGHTGCILMHQTLRTLWMHPGSTHTAPKIKRTGNVNSDAAHHSPMHPDGARHGICLQYGVWQGIFLLDAAVSGYFPSGCSCVRANGIWMIRVMAPWLRWLSRHGTVQQILALHSQTRSRFQT